MSRTTSLPFVLPLSLLLGGASCAPGSDAPAVHAEHAPEPASVTVFGERLLLFMEHPHLVRGTPARFLAHLTVLESGEPLRAGTVTLEIGPTRLSAEAPERERLFLPEGSPVEAGAFQARLVVGGGEVEESLDLGTIVVHASEADAEAARAAASEEPPGAVAFLMESQWRIRLLVAEAQTRTLRTGLTVPARAVVPEGLSARVSAAVAGRLAPPPSGIFPRTGDRVEAGQVLAFVEPPIGAPELAQLQALELELDLKALETLRAIGEAEARLHFAGRERERIETLRAEGLGTRQQLEQAEQSLALAAAEHDAAGRMRASLDRWIGSRAAGSGPGARLRIPLEAPVSGTIVEVLDPPGASIAAGASLARILDASRIWVEGRVSELDLERVRGAADAEARFEALPSRRFELRGPEGGEPVLGHEVEPSSRTLFVRYELENDDGAVRPGMLAELRISTGEHEARVVIPAEGVVMEQGIPTAYVMLAGELFHRRELELGLRDGPRVEVLRGIEPGERVATRGASIVRLAGLAPATFGAGHAH